MAKRLTEGFKLQEKSYRKKLKKQYWLKTLPTFKNLEIDTKYTKTYQELDIVVTNLLDISEKKKLTKIIDIKPYGSTFLITSIQCPECKSFIKINRYWNAFFCENGHSKKVYEICWVIDYEKEKNAESKNNIQAMV